MNSNKILIAVVVLVLLGGGIYLYTNQSAPADSTMEDQMAGDQSTSSEEMNLEGIHIMSDGSVMLGNGETVEDATVTEDGMIELPDGRIVEPVMDMREGGSMEDMDSMEGDSMDSMSN